MGSGPSGSVAGQSAGDSSTTSALEGCADRVDETFPCYPIALVDVDGSGSPAAIDLSVNANGRPTIRATTKPGAAPISASVESHRLPLTKFFTPEEKAKGTAFYQLDGRGGAEIVVPVGTFGSNDVFEVFSLRDGKLEALTPPGEALNLTIGMGNWVMPSDRVLTRVVCRDNGLSLGSVEPSAATGRMIDFTSKPQTTTRGEAGEWIVSKGWYDVDASVINDRTVGQAHFKCDDVRTASLDSSSAPAKSAVSTPASAAACTDKNMNAVVTAAIGTLREVNDWPWQPDGSPTPEACATLDFSTTTVKQATNSSPVAVLLFHEGSFVGTASQCHPPIRDIKRSGDDAVVVTYRYPRLGDSNAGMTGEATRTYRWQNGKVVATGDVPARLTQLAGCTP